VRFVSLVARLLGHADRVAPSRRKSTGLMLPVPRKGAGSMAAHLAPTRVRSEHQRLDHFVADAAWSDVAVLAAVRGRVPEAVVAHSGVPDALLIDDTGPPKQGTHSLRVARQTCGQSGKQARRTGGRSNPARQKQFWFRLLARVIPVFGPGSLSQVPVPD
jgi:SRSO17 transposase